MVADILRGVARRNVGDLEVELVTIRTKGEAVTDRPFAAIGPKGVFAAEIQRALLEDRIDLAVHSLKDLPADEPEGLELAAVCERGEVRDVLVSRSGSPLRELPRGSVVGTSSSRRRALVALERSDLKTALLRGNVDTRLDKVARGDVDAGVLAGAGLIRLGRQDAIAEWLDPEVFVPSPGQGALVIEATVERAAGDLAWVCEAEHAPTRRCVDAERLFMREVEGGCEVPLGAWARHSGDEMVLHGFVASDDAARCIRDTERGTDPQAVATELARRVLAAGAAELRQRREGN